MFPNQEPMPPVQQNISPENYQTPESTSSQSPLAEMLKDPAPDSGSSSDTSPHPGSQQYQKRASDRCPVSEKSMALIEQLRLCENFADGILKRQIFAETSDGDLNNILCQLGDEIVCELVRWMKQLPFYSEIPLEAQSDILAKRWHQVLVFATSVNQAWNQNKQVEVRNRQSALAGQMRQTSKKSLPSLSTQIQANYNKVLQYFKAKFDRDLDVKQLQTEVGNVIETVTQLTYTLAQSRITAEEYLCFKVILLMLQG